MQKQEGNALSGISDELIFEVAASRLRTRYEREKGSEFLFGSFRFIFHDGIFQCVEDWPRHRSYISNKSTIKKER